MDIPVALKSLPLHAMAAIIAGLVVLLAPRVLNYVVAAYLLVIGTVGLLQFYYGQSIRPQAAISLDHGSYS